MVALRGVHMEWSSVVAVGDVVIVRQEPPSASRFVVHGRQGAQQPCATYAEAETRAASYAAGTQSNVWYVERGRLQLVSSGPEGERGRGTIVRDPHE